MRRADPGQVGRTAGRGDDHFHPAAFGGAHITGSLFRGAVRRKYAAFVFHAELRQHLVGLAHDIPVRLAAHDHSNQWTRAHAYCPCARVNPAWPSKLRSVSVTAMSIPAAEIRCTTSSSLPMPVWPSAMKRQRKLSVQKVSGRPSGQTLTLRLSIICSVKPSPASLPTASARALGLREGQ